MNYDDWKTDCPPSDNDPEPDEGIALLDSAIAYLEKNYASDDDAMEATGEMYGCQCAIRAMYQCHECGCPVPKGQSFCSRNCYQASQI